MAMLFRHARIMRILVTATYVALSVLKRPITPKREVLYCQPWFLGYLAAVGWPFFLGLF